MGNSEKSGVSGFCEGLVLGSYGVKNESEESVLMLFRSEILLALTLSPLSFSSKQLKLFFNSY